MKTIFITGANRGIGLELAKQYYSDGWKVIAGCRNFEKTADLKKISAHDQERLKLLKLDVTNQEDINNLSSQLKDESIDILVNNAGVIGSYTATFDNEIDSCTWQNTFIVNTIAPLLVTQALVNQLIKSEDKLVVNVSSAMGSTSLNTSGGNYLYGSSKAALNYVTKSMSVDLKDKGIRVISLHPGWVRTDMGGEQAPIVPSQSVEGIRHILNSLKSEETGIFVAYDGNQLSW